MSTTTDNSAAPEKATWSLLITGRIQGVGFRPFLHREALLRQLSGFCRNVQDGVEVTVSGAETHIEHFIQALRDRPPTGAHVTNVRPTQQAYKNYNGFRVRTSRAERQTSSAELEIPLDRAVCRDCLDEYNDPKNRRYQYPFISCVDCGPRYSVLRALPFDRERTSFAPFQMCSACAAEYTDPTNRRYHCQTISCPRCGPTLEYFDGKSQHAQKHSWKFAQKVLAQGGLLGVKATGGYQIVCDAAHDEALCKLRRWKHRPDKPFAILVGNEQQAQEFGHITTDELSQLRAPSRPIVLVRKNPAARLSGEVTKGLGTLGLMLPHHPVQAELLKIMQGPLVITSANRSGVPMLIEDELAEETLQEVCEGLLRHNYEITHRIDDAVVQLVGHTPQVLRHGRGTSPFYMTLPERDRATGVPTLACGGHSKNTVALASGRRTLLSPHIGTLASTEQQTAWRDTVSQWCKMKGVQPERIVTDRHTEYGSTRMAQGLDGSRVQVQHHTAHVMACAWEHDIRDDALALAWDGSGLGDDGKIWGGEFMHYHGLSRSPRRVGHFQEFCLIGGEQAIKQPRRSAYAVVNGLPLAEATRREILAPLIASDMEQRLFEVELEKQRFMTTSVGRLFDAVAALLGVCRQTSFSAQAPLLLEHLAARDLSYLPFAFAWQEQGDQLVIDWRPTFVELLRATSSSTPAVLSARWHHTLVEIAIDAAERLGLNQLMACGGVFHNRFLLELLSTRSRERGLRCYFPQRVPAGDGGLAAGQLYFNHCGMGE